MADREQQAHVATRAAKAPRKDHKSDICGIIMPISDMDGYPNGHWADVRQIIDEAIVIAEMTPQIVSDSILTDVIHKSIITNLVDNKVVVCCTSGLNPNVMFEMGLRIALQKPIVVVHDGDVKPPFDVTTIKYIAYPKDLHIHKTKKFIHALAERITELAKQVDQGEYVSVLSSLGALTVPDFDVAEVSPTEYLSSQMDEILVRLKRMEGRRYASGLLGARQTVGLTGVRLRITGVDPLRGRRAVTSVFDILDCARPDVAIESTGLLVSLGSVSADLLSRITDELMKRLPDAKIHVSLD